MSNDFIVRGSKELLLVAERMAFEKNIPTESVLIALEEGVKVAVKKGIYNNMQSYIKLIFHMKLHETS